MLDVCRAFGEADPAWFYALPTHLQDLWLEDAANNWTGAYVAKGTSAPQSASDAMKIQTEGIARARGRNHGTR